MTKQTVHWTVAPRQEDHEVDFEELIHDMEEIEPEEESDEEEQP